MQTEKTLTGTPVQPIVLPPFAPYYTDDSVTIYNMDCRKVLPWLGRFDLVLTDPPYGIGFAAQPTMQSRKKGEQPEAWDDVVVPDWVIQMAIDCGDKAILWGGNYYRMNPSRMFLVWEKGNRLKGRSFAECEHAWCSWNGNAKVFSHDVIGTDDFKKVHPTQKPLAVIRWCMSQVPEAKTIVDPFAGSGTTGVAAKLEGRKATLIEISEEYCEKAADRLRQGVLF